MAQQPHLLHARSIVKSFGPTNVLKGFDLSIAPGEVHAFLGGNGAGKSTFIKIISGQHERDSGTLEFDGREMGASSASPVDSGMIAVVNQELALLPHLSVAENIAMPRLHRAMRTYSERTSKAVAIEALSLIDPHFARESVGRLVGHLTLHERQLVEIARSLGSGARLLLLDEPTANLTAAETARLFAVLRKLIADTQLAVLFVSHRMREIRQIADVCTIIRDGKTAVDRVPLSDITDREIVEFMGQSVAPDERGDSGAGEGIHLNADSEPSSEETAVHAEAITIRHDDIEVEVGPGSIIGLAGAPTGPAALIEALTGLAMRTAWDIRRNGTTIRYRCPSAAARAGVGYISGDRANKGILATLPIIDNLMAARRIVERRSVARSEELVHGASLLHALKIRAGSLWDLPSTLSGGTQQKILVARWLALKPKLLILEEPTRGVDIRTKREIYTLIRKLAAQGTAVVWWSTEYVELVELCDTVLAFDLSGRPTGVLHHPEVDETNLANATGMAA
ncbi:sugar ABC transporter ATP-binding protein [Paraburkholderia sp. MM5384-R2]|uniref:sugar ABC transporter ATP-binding protein n=1 Tax=Paraburkholderia sp. MM5384-R2 TaxID=2723097 RepID=UPI00161B4813|nr:sugar ABC transporter ATP-binding protein [Paraburkholderia sp. MM5384-R2]MBB5502994.1 ribose transport system ATP-binding protein [Paraburkholderia sp. MM5384-R2]